MDDEDLLGKLLVGDEQAFRELVSRYHTALVRVARFHVANDAAAEDVAQDTWVAVLKGVHRFEGRSTFKTWLFRICVNRARTSGMRDHRQVPTDVADEASVAASRFNESGMWADPPVPFDELVDGRLDDAKVAAAIHAAIAALPDTQQAVVTLRDVEGLSSYEVSSLLGLTEANVRVILHRGRAKVRAAIESAIRRGEL